VVHAGGDGNVGVCGVGCVIVHVGVCVGDGVGVGGGDAVDIGVGMCMDDVIGVIAGVGVDWYC